MHIAEVDRAYAVYFPYMERYVSLYPVLDKEDLKDPDKSSAERALRAERPKLWKTVEAAMAKGQGALEKLRDRRLANDSRSKPPPRAPSKHSFAAKAKGLKARLEKERGAAVGSAGEKKRKWDVGDVGDEELGGMSDDRAKRLRRGGEEDSEDSDAEGFLEE